MTIIDRRHSYFSVASTPGPIPELDGLRGIAILLVLLRHAARPVFEENGSIWPLRNWDIAVPLLNGWMGVDLFFVLSGFLITHHLLQRWPTRFNVDFLWRYWLRRVLRTFPAYYVTLIVVATGLLPFYRPTVENFAAAMLQHILFLQDYFGSVWNPAFWSLGVEEKFYLLCPFLLLWLGRHPRARQLSILAALALLPMLLRALTLASQTGAIETYEQFFWAVRAPFHLALDGLWLGVMCALAYRWRRPVVEDRQRARHALLLAGISLIFVLQFSVAWFDDRHFGASVVVLGLVPLGFAGIVLAVTLGPTVISAWLRGRWLRFMAEISYSVYLTHLIVVWPAMQVVEALMPRMSDPSPMVEFALFFPIFICLALIAGLLLHFTVEKPFLLLKSRVRMG